MALAQTTVGTDLNPYPNYSPNQFNANPPTIRPDSYEVDGTIRRAVPLAAATVPASGVVVQTVTLTGLRPNDGVEFESQVGNVVPNGLAILGLASQDQLELVLSNNTATDILLPALLIFVVARRRPWYR